MCEEKEKQVCEAEKKAPACRFIRIGGGYQPVISGSRDFEALLNLDDAHWEVTSLSVTSLRTDKRFLDFLDTDKNGSVRTDEVRNALRFLMDVFRDLSDVDKAESVIDLNKINTDNAIGQEIYSAARTMLSAIGKGGENSISLEEVTNDSEIKKCSHCNGDGVVTAAADDESDTAKLIRLAEKIVGSQQDLSGATGINAKELADFSALAAAYTAWVEDGNARSSELNPYGDATADLSKLASELKTPISKFFLSSSAVAFFEDDPERLAKREIVADVRSAGEVGKLLDETAIAAPDKSGLLRGDAVLNPLWKDKYQKLCAMEAFSAFLENGNLSEKNWNAFLAGFSVRDAYLSSNPAAGKFDGVDVEELKKLNSTENVGAVSSLIQRDIDAGCALAGSSKLLKAVLFQRYMLEFLRNYANLTELFKISSFSMLQTGTLVMDGRHFTLVVPVVNIAEHKKIVATSNICVAYVEVTGGAAGAVTKSTVAVAITNGSMSNLFPGKRGIFYSADGKTCDAKVIDFIEQPVSIPDALKKPFLNMGQFVSKQFDKLVSTQAGSVQKDLGTQLSSGKPLAPQGNANGTMLLMSGSIGLAAIGSSVAFIAKSLQNVSIMTVLGVLLGIVVVFGGPCVTISLTKLYRRDLARFLEAAGCALNHKMRLTFKLGLFFTFSPRRPGSLEEELFDANVSRKTLSCPLTVSLIILVAALFGFAGFFGGAKFIEWHNGRKEKKCCEIVQKCDAKTSKTAQSVQSNAKK